MAFRRFSHRLAGPREAGLKACAGLLVLLCLAHVSNIVMQTTLAVVAQPMKIDLRLSDSQLGLVLGIAYSLTSGLLAVPLGIAADRYGRNRVLFLSLGVMAAAGHVMSLATSYVQLLLARLASGLGDAGVVPAGVSLLSDRVSPASRPAAISIFGTGASVGGLVTYFGMSVVSQRYGWRTAFEVGSALGAVTALCCLTLIRDGGTRIAVPTDFASFKFLRDPVYLHAGMAFVASGFVTGATWNWAAPVLQRSYGLSIQEAGAFLGVGFGVANLAGMLFFGAVLSAARKRHPSGPFWVATPVYLSAALIFSLALFMDDFRQASYLLIVSLFLSSTVFIAVMSSIQDVVPKEMRASAVAFSYLMLALIGQGLGPVVTGALSDWLEPLHGRDALRVAVRSLMAIGCLWVCGHLLAAAFRLKGRAVGSTHQFATSSTSGVGSHDVSPAAAPRAE